MKSSLKFEKRGKMQWKVLWNFQKIGECYGCESNFQLFASLTWIDMMKKGTVCINSFFASLWLRVENWLLVFEKILFVFIYRW